MFMSIKSLSEDAAALAPTPLNNQGVVYFLYKTFPFFNKSKYLKFHSSE